MERKYIITASVVVIGLLLFFGYRQTSRQAAFDEDKKKASTVMVAMARTSPTGGLTQMAAALKRYEQDNGRFPETLQKLYPKYIAHKAFIDDISWDYHAEQHDFTLKKRFTKNNRRMVASIDKALRPRIQTRFMVASASDVSSTVAPKQTEPAASAGTPASERGQAARAFDERLQALLEQPVSPEPARVAQREATYITSPTPEPFSIVGAETCTGPSLELSQRHLVWKDREGFLGFGNVEYPGAERLTIAAEGQWVDVKRAGLETQEPEEPVYTALEPRRTFFGVEIR